MARLYAGPFFLFPSRDLQVYCLRANPDLSDNAGWRSDTPSVYLVHPL